ncbi:MAG: right-handed parallel beta-helix repeat-containing protein [bacterium]|jgi:parallel beta-helix repeat protein
MKQTFIFVTILAATACFTSCQKKTNVSPDNQALSPTVEMVKESPVAYKPDMAAINELIASNEARLALLSENSQRECVETAMVPDDFPTIQEAIDAVCEGGNVLVKTGIYNEILTVYKPDLNIKAIGDVTLNGRFFLNSDANGVKIQKFKIIIPDALFAIFADRVEGGEFIQNSISGSGFEGDAGIVYWRSNGASIKNNQVSNVYWGILCATYLDDGFTSNNNMILNNTVTGITGLTCVGLQFNSDYNVINGNYVVENPIWNNAGIMLNSWPEGDNSCDHNIVKNNVVNENGFRGIWLDDGGHYNTVGPNNTANANALTGIMLDMYSSNNHVFNNTALENLECDIVDEGGTDNTYKNNTAECTSGL